MEATRHDVRRSSLGAEMEGFESQSLTQFDVDFIAFPNALYSGLIISSIVKEKGHLLVRRTAEYQLLLGALALPGVFIGALLVNRIGRRNTSELRFRRVRSAS